MIQVNSSGTAEIVDDGGIHSHQLACLRGVWFSIEILQFEGADSRRVFVRQPLISGAVEQVDVRVQAVTNR